MRNLLHQTPYEVAGLFNRKVLPFSSCTASAPQGHKTHVAEPWCGHLQLDPKAQKRSRRVLQQIVPEVARESCETTWSESMVGLRVTGG